MSEDAPGPATRTRWAWAAGYGVSTFFAFPQPIPGHETVVDLGLVCAPLAVGCFLMMLEGLPRRPAIKLGFFAGLVTHFVFFHWFYVVTVTYGHAPPILGWLSPLLPALYVSLFASLFAGSWQLLRASGLATPVAAALLFTAVDHFRGNAFGGFPWASLGYAQHLNTPLLGLAQYTGVYGLTFAVALTGAGLAEWLRRPAGARRPPRSTVIAFGVVFALHALGAISSMSDAAEEQGSSLRVAALQGNVDPNEKWSDDRVSDNLGRYLELSRRAIEAGAQVVVWPESAVPGLIEFQFEIRDSIATLAREHGTTFVLGATGATLDAETGRLERVYDSAFLMGPVGNLTDRYDKTHLVPFGEFVPFRRLIGQYFEAVARGMATQDVTQGETPRALSLPLIDRSHDTRIGVPICYELLFPDLVRRFAHDGARVLFAITNDAWYGRTGAPYQFLAMTALRSAENSLWTVRAANSGVSAIIDDRGRVVRRSKIFVQDLLVDDIPLSPAGGDGTFYSRRGDVFALSCWIGALGLLLVAIAIAIKKDRENRIASSIDTR
ncbi:MAG: apolipoprotein N-acyltransferase [Deltaproteobacteria bacterium]|nr:apolipoprotein N-acyltransferase [Deltaproteobacteria bacterium]